MNTRVKPVFVVTEEAPFFIDMDVEFEILRENKISEGQEAVSAHHEVEKERRRVNLKRFHEAFLRQNPGKRVLEISDRAENPIGMALSTSKLLKYVPQIRKAVPVECACLASGIYEQGGPYVDLLGMPPAKARREERLNSSGELLSYYFDGEEFPPAARVSVYYYLYLRAVQELQSTAQGSELVKELLSYDAFTDASYNSKKNPCSPAKAAAVFVALCRSGKIESVKDFAAFRSLYGEFLKE